MKPKIDSPFADEGRVDCIDCSRRCVRDQQQDEMRVQSIVNRVKKLIPSRLVVHTDGVAFVVHTRFDSLEHGIHFVEDNNEW